MIHFTITTTATTITVELHDPDHPDPDRAIVDRAQLPRLDGFARSFDRALWLPEAEAIQDAKAALARINGYAAGVKI